MNASHRRRWCGGGALIVMAVAAALSGVVAAQQATFSARREVVRVDVLVTDHNRPVLGLRGSDFELFDSGVRQTVTDVGFQELPLNVTLALDASVSMSGERLEHLRSAARAVLDTMRAEDKTAVLTFDDTVTELQPLTANVAQARESVNGIGASRRLSGGGTALRDAIFAALTLTAAQPGRSLLLVFTDGLDTSSWLTAERLVASARRSNAVVYAVSAAGLDEDVGLRRLADTTGGGVVKIGKTDALRSTFLTIMDEFRQRYVVSFSPDGVPPSGWHPLTVRVKGRSVTVRARPGYTRGP
jgi:VWFA-related protein